MENQCFIFIFIDTSIFHRMLNIIWLCFGCLPLAYGFMYNKFKMILISVNLFDYLTAAELVHETSDIIVLDLIV